MPSIGFTGPCYQSRSIAVDGERSINMFPELVESGHDASPGAKNWALYGTPGRQLYCTLSDSPVACLVSANQQSGIDSVTPCFFAIAGSTLYAIANHYDGSIFTGVTTVIGTVDKKPLPYGQLFPAQIIVLSTSLIFVVANGRTWVAAYGAPITGSTLNQGGMGYAVGDTGKVIGGTGLTARYTVLSVDANGAVLTYSLSTGVGYSVAVNDPTEPAGTQPGSGDGNFTINVTTIGTVAWALVEQFIPEGFAPGSFFIQSATFMDNYVIVSISGNAADPYRRQFYISGVSDPSSWSPLDFGTKEGNSDPNAAVFAANEILNVFGITTMERWLDTPNGPAFPFQRMSSGMTNVGLAAPYTVCIYSNTVVWLGNDQQGQLVAWMLEGGSPKRISNFAIENSWRNYDVTGSSAYTYEEDGHYFFVIHFPIPDQTWACDLSTIGPDGKPCWHERLSWDGVNWHADIGRYHAWSFPVAHVVGDYSNGNLYIQSVDILADNCNPIRRLRATPHVNNELKWNWYSRFRLQLQTGIVPEGITTPTYSLRFSDDGGFTWSNYLDRSGGALGNYEGIIPVEWYRLGRSRNRVFEITTNSAVQQCWVDGYIEVRPGTGV